MEPVDFTVYLKELTNTDPIPEPEYKCRKCRDYGTIIMVDQFKHSYAHICECQFKQGRDYPLKYCFEVDIAPLTASEFSAITLSPAQASAYAYCTEFVRQNKNLAPYLYGKMTGSGKTMLAQRLGINYAKIRNKRTQFVSVDTIKNMFNDCYENDRSVNSILNELKYNCDLLILDDVGAERITEAYEQNLYTILDYRFNKKLPTAFTSNYRIQELPYNQRIISRIYGMSQEIELNDYDWRKNKRSETR